MYKSYFITILFLLTTNAMAGAEYDREKNSVSLTTPLLAKNIDTGFITIYNEKHITIMGSAIDDASGKLIGMCGKDPSLGLLILDGNLKIGTKTPNVTEVENWDSEKSPDAVKAGWVRRFVLKGDDALDLMDLLYEYRSVGFAFTGSNCQETKNTTSGKLILNFETRGLERAMKRLK